MSIILLTSIILTLAPVHMGQEVFFTGNSMTSDLASSLDTTQPCENSSNDDAYDKFAERHILREEFNRFSKAAWKNYLEKKNLCGRNPVQSFIEKQNENKVKGICRSLGFRLVDESNLCRSKKRIQMYNINSSFNNNACSVTVPQSIFSQFVIVACNKVKNVCLPVHFERYNGQEAAEIDCTHSA